MDSGGQPLHGVRCFDRIKQGKGKVWWFYFDFQMYWATNIRVDGKIKRKEKYVGRFQASYNADKQSKTIAEDFPDYWRLDSIRVHTYSEAGRRLDIIERDFARFKKISVYHILARLKMNDIDEAFFLEKLCQHLDKIEKEFIREKEESEDFSTVQG